MLPRVIDILRDLKPLLITENDYVFTNTERGDRLTPINGARIIGTKH